MIIHIRTASFHNIRKSAKALDGSHNDHRITRFQTVSAAGEYNLVAADNAGNDKIVDELQLTERDADILKIIRNAEFSASAFPSTIR